MYIHFKISNFVLLSLSLSLSLSEIKKCCRGVYEIWNRHANASQTTVNSVIFARVLFSHIRSFAKIKSSLNGEITLSITDIGKSCKSRDFIAARMSFNAICENRILANISGYKIYIPWKRQRISVINEGSDEVAQKCSLIQKIARFSLTCTKCQAKSHKKAHSWCVIRNFLNDGVSFEPSFVTRENYGGRWK